MKRTERALAAVGSSLLAAALLISTGGCASTQAPNAAAYTDEVEYLNARAEHAFSTKEYLRARVLWQQLSKDFPYSEYASLADLRVADSYFAEKAYAAAAESYRAFTRLRPRHEKVPYAEFRVVESYAKMMPRERFFSPPTHERDLTDALIAYREGRRFLVRHRTTEYFEPAKEIVQQVADRLAAHEIYVARYYERRENYLGAMRRGAYVVASFTESTLVPEAYLIQARNAFAVEEYQTVRDALAQIANTHGDAAELVAIQALVDAIPSGEAASDAPDEPELMEDPGLSWE